MKSRLIIFAVSIVGRSVSAHRSGTRKTSNCPVPCPRIKRSRALLAGLLVNALVSVGPAGAQSITTLADQAPAGLVAAGIPRRLIAIDNVCAWPNLVKLQDGSLAALIFNQPSHGKIEGDIECWTSADGLFWKRASTVTRHLPQTVRMNHAAGLNRDGDLVVLCSGWDSIRVGEKLPSTSRVLHAVAAISRDGGRSWERGENPALPDVPGYSWQIPFGDIVEAANGDLVVGAYALGKQAEILAIDKKNPDPRRDPKFDGFRSNIYVARSRDGGRTWERIAPMIKDRHAEAAMLHAGGGRWLAACRRIGYRDLEIFGSDDDAFTWRSLGVMEQKEFSSREGPRVSAAHLLKLSDGRILLTYGNRTAGDKGIDVRTSTDGGKTWGPPQRLGDYSFGPRHRPGVYESGDSGYPDAVELPRGRILVGYYSGGIPMHQRYHMGVINLTVEEVR